MCKVSSERWTSFPPLFVNDVVAAGESDVMQLRGRSPRVKRGTKMQNVTQIIQVLSRSDCRHLKPEKVLLIF